MFFCWIPHTLSQSSINHPTNVYIILELYCSKADSQVFVCAGVNTFQICKALCSKGLIPLSPYVNISSFDWIKRWHYVWNSFKPRLYSSLLLIRTYNTSSIKYSIRIHMRYIMSDGAKPLPQHNVLLVFIILLLGMAIPLLWEMTTLRCWLSWFVMINTTQEGVQVKTYTGS